MTAAPVVRRHRTVATPAELWRFRRVVERTDAIESLLAEHAAAYVGRPLRRREVLPLESAVAFPGVTWSIEEQVVAELLVAPSGPSRLVVYDISLLAAIRRALRTRHITVERPAYQR